MSIETDATRSAALSLVEAAGMSWKRVGVGQRYVVHVQHGGRSIRALVKTASRGAAMVRTDTGDPDRAKLSGFNNDVDYVLFAVGNPDSREVSAYLVPIGEVVAAYRSKQRAWMAGKPTRRANTTWVIRFDEHAEAEGSGLHEKWRHYRIGRDKTLATPATAKKVVPSIEEVKVQLAARFGVSPNKVKISIEC